MTTHRFGAGSNGGGTWRGSSHADVDEQSGFPALLARGFGLHTCPQQAWVSFHRTVRTFLRLPENLMIYSGMALGYEDAAASINYWRSPREPLDVYATIDVFES